MTLKTFFLFVTFLQPGVGPVHVRTAHEDVAACRAALSAVSAEKGDHMIHGHCEPIPPGVTP